MIDVRPEVIEVDRLDDYDAEVYGGRIRISVFYPPTGKGNRDGKYVIHHVTEEEAAGLVDKLTAALTKS